MECVQFLVQAAADVNQTSVDGSSPLLVAVQNGHYDIARFLMEHAANPNLATPRLDAPLSGGEKSQSGNDGAACPGRRRRAGN